MTLKQKQFIKQYASPDSETYSNGTKSYMEVYNADYDTAKARASKLLTNDNIKQSIEELIDKMDMGSKVRLNTIKEVLTGTYKQTTETTSQDKDGNTYTAKSTKTPTASDRLKAVDLLAKIDGTYDKNKAKADIVSSELKELIKQQRKELNK